MRRRMPTRESCPPDAARPLFIPLSSTANACFKDAADLHAELEEYPAAILRYQQVADHSLSSSLTKYSVKEYWLRASLCALAMRVRHYIAYRSRCSSESRYRTLLPQNET